MSPLVLSFLKSAAVPAVIVAVLFLLTGGLREPWRARLQALVLALGFVLGNYILIGRLHLPPHDVSESLSYVALLFALFVLVSPSALGSRYLVRAVFVVAAGALILFHIWNSSGGTMFQRNMLAFFFLGLGVWSILERMQHKVKTPTLLLLPLMAASALSLFVLFKGSASMSQQVSILCTLLGALLVVSAVFPQWVSAAAVLPFVSAFVITLMAAAHFYLDINPWHLVYLCIPYLFLWIRDWMPFIPRQPVPEAITLGALAALPLGYFVWNAYTIAGPLS